MSLYRVGNLAFAVCGRAEFWAAVQSEFAYARSQERSHLTYDEWDGLFDKAVEAGVAAVHVDSKGEPQQHFAGPFGYALLRLWRAVRDAKARGLTAREFSAEFSDVVKGDIERRREQAQRSDKDAAKRRSTIVSEKRGGYSKPEPVLSFDDETTL